MTMTFNVAGNLARPPEFETFGGDGVLARITVASDRRTVVDGVRTTQPDFHHITLFGDVAEQLRNAGTGDKVGVTGDVRPTRYVKDGVEVHGHSFVGKKAEWQSKGTVNAEREAARTQQAGQEHVAEEHKLSSITR